MKRLAATGLAVALAVGIWSGGAGPASGADHTGEAAAMAAGGPLAPRENGRGRVAHWQAGARGWELLLAGQRGEDARVVYRTPVSPAESCVGRVMEWSPDGGTLAFCAAPVAGAGTRIFVVREDGTGLRCLTRGVPSGPRGESDPCWSPDGTLIAFLREEGGPAAPRGVWAMRPDGSGRARMMADAAVPVGTGATPVLRWSPDGTRLSWRAQPLWIGLAGR